MKYAGAVIVMVFVIAVWFAAYKNRNHQEYDERQMEYRGKAYRTAFLVTAALCVGCGIFLYMYESFIKYAVFMLMGSAFAGITVFAVIAIWKDAFYSTAQKPGSYLLLVGIVVVLNLISLMGSFPEETWEEVLTSVRCMNLLGAVTFSIVGVTFFCKMLKERNEAE